MHSLGDFSTQPNKTEFISSLVILADIIQKCLFQTALQLFPHTTLGPGYRWRFFYLCRWIFHCQSSKTLPECSGQNWIPPLKIQSNFTDLKKKEKDCNCSWPEGFSFQAPWLFSDVFLRLGILELLGSSHNDLGLFGSLCSNSCVKMNSIVLPGPQLLCWPVHLESCCQSGWFNSTGHLDFSQCCSYYFIPACQVVSQHRQSPT